MRVAILGLLAVIVGGATIYFAREWLANERAAASEVQRIEVEATEVLVAVEPMSAGRFVKPEDLRWQPWPVNNVAEAYIELGELTVDDFIGSVVRTGVAEGEPITLNRVVKPGDRGFLAAVLIPGMRAISVPVDETSGIAGLVFPGDRVDVILTHSVRQDTAQGVQVRRASETVLTDVRVLAIDQMVEQSAGPVLANTATLEVTPEQAEKVRVMLQLGSLSLSLRSLAEVPASADATPADDGSFVDRLASSLAGMGRPGGPDMRNYEGQTFTLDSDVSILLGPAEENQVSVDEPAPDAEPTVIIFRGGASRDEE